NDVMDADLTAEAAMRAKRPDLARPQFERALALLPAEGPQMVRLDLLNDRGFASVLLGDTATARASWRAVLDLDPTFRPAALNLARLDQQAGQLGASRAALERLLVQAPEDADALAILAEVQRMQGDLPGARATIARLAAVSPAR